MKIKNKNIFIIFIGLIVGIVIGLILLKTNLNTQNKVLDIISPIQNVYITGICYLAMPLIFICLITSIYRMGDLKTFGKVGLRSIFIFLIVMFAIGLTSTLLGVLIFNVDFGNSKNELTNTLELFKNFIPKDYLTPFITKNILQVNFMGIILGLTLLITGQEAQWFINLLNKINRLLTKVFSIISKLIPIYVLLSMIKIVLLKEFSSIIGLWKMVLTFILMLVILMLFYFVRTLILSKNKKTIFKSLPIFIIGFTTANSTLSLDKAIDVSKNKYNVKDDFAKFSIPLGMILYKPASVIWLSVVACYFASTYGLVISFTWILSTAIVTTILNVAVPPVPAGGVNNYSIMFNELLIPLTSLPLVIVLDSIFEFVITGFNVWGQSIECYCLAKYTKNIEVKK